MFWKNSTNTKWCNKNYEISYENETLKIVIYMQTQ